MEYTWKIYVWIYIDGLAQDCGNARALEVGIFALSHQYKHSRTYMFTYTMHIVADISSYWKLQDRVA